MATAADVRRIVATLPETTENQTWGSPNFRVRNKIFASLNDEHTLGFSVHRDERMELIAAEPETFFMKVGHDDNFHFARAHLDRLDTAELTELLTDAWRRVAPARLRKEFDSAAPSGPADRAE